MTTERKVGVGLYGANGHQIQAQLEDHPLARWVASAEVAETPEGVRRHPDLDALLADPEVELVSFCSPLRSEQGEHIIRCLEAGKHAYAEKPCCMDEATLDRILETVTRTGMRFHEMAGTALEQPYATLREIVTSGVIGEVIQVLSQKSYPWADWRPGDENIDGGLATQAGVYTTRFVEHVAGVKIASIEMRETTLGNTVPGSDCRRAVSFLMTFENGGVGSAVTNYCCPASPGWEKWGYENLRIFGDKGFVESIDCGRAGILAVEGQTPKTLDFSTPGEDFLDLYVKEILSESTRIPFDLETETRPTRWVLRAKHG